jgi:hypothetical protein
VRRADPRSGSSGTYPEWSVAVDDDSGLVGSCPKSVPGVTSAVDAGVGATGFGRVIALAAGFGAGFFGAAFGAAFGGAAFFGTGRFAAAFFATAFFGAAFFAFLATLALPAFFAGRAFLFATLFLAAARFAFACGRFFPLAFFFAMVSHLLGVTPISRESSPEKVRCHLRAALESTMGIAYAAVVLPNDPIRPLHDVWLRPRRVFRELSTQPVGRADLLLGAAQGIVGFLGYCRALNTGASYGLVQIFGAATAAGAILGILSLYVMGTIYARLGGGAQIPTLRRQAIHVLAYGAVPVAVSLGIWILTALIAGDATFLATPRAEDEGFVAILLSAQFISYILLMLWSVLLQVMGFSEILKITTGRAFGIWALGQLVGVLAALFMAEIVTMLIPGR